MKQYSRAFTHGGRFHADDVFSAALLQLVYPGIEIQRGFQVPKEYDGIVFDIGFGEYDHHQADKKVRENGVPYAAFGLLWQTYGITLVGEKIAQKFDEEFIQPLDEADNTGCKNELSELIGRYNPGWDENLDSDACFAQAKQIAQTILERKLAYMQGDEKADEILEEAMKQTEGAILVLDRFVPWKKKVVGSGIVFVIYPSNRGGYHAQGVPVSQGNTELVCPFPEQWRGKSEEELQQISQIATARFCHNSGFLFAAQELEDVKDACVQALSTQKQNVQQQEAEAGKGENRCSKTEKNS